ncbi:MAG: hypothetical protein Q9179_001464 [Wetmoreana sp. 5 TL-2023]
MDAGHGKNHGRCQNAPPLPRTTHDEEQGINKDCAGVPAAVYVASWMILSSVVILFNKWILDRARYPILLTCYHLVFATIMTQILACTSSLLDGRHSIRMTPKLYIRAIVPIGVLYSLSLVCSNFPYLYLSVAFIQMLKGTASIAVFLALCSLRLTSPTLRVVLNLLVIVFGVVLASLGEIKFHAIGFLYQMGGIIFEAYRLAFIQKLLSDEKYKMDPLIGKTSSLVLTLCGVLKNISLIAASMFIWGTVVTPIQFVGNGIALTGLVYYQLGAEKVRSIFETLLACLEGLSRTDRGRLAIVGSLAMCCVVFSAIAAACWVFDGERNIANGGV